MKHKTMKIVYNQVSCFMFCVACFISMNGFTKKSIGAVTLGEKLKKIRSDKRISLSEVSRLTRIQISYLEYLEEGNYDKLPADVYTKGFLRSYADFLGVDEKILLKIYEREKDIRNNLDKKNGNYPVEAEKVNISSFVFTPKKILFVVVLVIVFSGLFFLYKEIDSFANAPNLIILNPVNNNSETVDNSIIVEGMTDKDARLLINEQPSLVNDEGKFREKLTLQKGLNTINIKSINKFEKESIKIVNVNSTYIEKEINNPESVSENEIEEKKIEEEAGIFKIDVRVDPGPVWLKVEADGSLVFDGAMLSGAVQIFKAKEKIIISSGKGEVTFVTFNGVDIGALSKKPGPAREVVFTPETKVPKVENITTPEVKNP